MTMHGILLSLAYLLRIKRVKDWTLYPLARKARAFKLHERETRTLVLGSSHAQMGYLAVKGEFNFGMGAQDLYYVYEIYRQYGRKMKDIVVFYSVFSSGDLTIRSQYAYTCVAYKVVFGIDWADEAEARKHYLDSMVWTYRRKMRRWLKRHPLKEDDFGNEEDYCAFAAGLAEERAKAHLKRFHRKVDMGVYLDRLVADAKALGQKVWIVIPPASQGYRKVVNAVDGAFARAWETASRYDNVTVLDYFNDGDFNDGDFIDCDHLGREGAAKLTNKIRHAMHRHMEK